MLSWIWVIMVVLAIAAGAVNGTLGAVGDAAIEGAQAAVTLCLGLLAPIVLWSGLMELLKAGGVLRLLSKIQSPFLKRLFPKESKKEGSLELISANISANILGLGNAATPLGIAAAKRLGAACAGGIASNELCRLVIVNTASIQLFPMTVAAIRASQGAKTPFDILPAVWVSSAAALAAGLAIAFVCGRLFKEKNDARAGKT